MRGSIPELPSQSQGSVFLTHSLAVLPAWGLDNVLNKKDEERALGMIVNTVLKNIQKAESRRHKKEVSEADMRIGRVGNIKQLRMETENMPWTEKSGQQAA